MPDQLENLRQKLEEIAGSFLIVELKLRLLVERNSTFRDELYRQIASEKPDRNQYWNCHLPKLCSAFLAAFENKLTFSQKQRIKTFNKTRNKALHADLPGLFEVLGISQDGQEILRSGKRNQLIWPDNKEEAVKNNFLNQAIQRLGTNDTITEVRSLCTDFNEAIDPFLRKTSP